MYMSNFTHKRLSLYVWIFLVRTNAPQSTGIYPSVSIST